MRLGSSTSIVYIACLLASGVGCTPEPPPKTPPTQEGVPANSLSDARLHGEEDPSDKEKRAASSSREPTDPSQPYTTKVGETPIDPTAGSSSAPPKTGGAGGGGGGKGVVSKGECDRVMDKYIDLEIAKNPDLKGVPQDVIDQAKQMARDKHGEAPCTATRAQYTCAMSATSTAVWQKCMK